MPPKRFPPDDPREWLNRARSNLARAKARIPEAYLEDLCFDAQQAVEKSLKAVLLKYRVSFPYVHDLAELLTLLEKAGVPIPTSIQAAGRLTRFAVTTRYPGITEPVTEEEHNQAVTTAEAVLTWAEEQVRA